MRSLRFTAPQRWLLPAPVLSSVRLTFTHSSGQITEVSPFVVRPPNNPPPNHVFVTGLQSFLDNPVAITRRTERTATIECNLGTLTDVDGDPLTFAWRIRPDEMILSTLPRFTNGYSPGLYFVETTVSDGTTAITAGTAFSVLTPGQALAQLRSDVDTTFGDFNKRRLEMPLRFASSAIRRREWQLAARLLQVFSNRVNRLIESEENPPFYERWSRAAAAIKYVVAKPQPGILQPPVFPSPEPRPPIPSQR